MTTKGTAEIEFEPNPDWNNEQETQPQPFRLEHLPDEEANQPSGRGTETAAARGYDAEQVACLIKNGTTKNRERWFDVRYGHDPETLLECKACINRYPCGNAGTFKIWRPHHKRLLWTSLERGIDGDVDGLYFFLVYTVIDEQAYEIGKFTVLPWMIESLIDEWRYEDHDTMGYTACREITWTRLMSELEIDIESLRANELLSGSLEGSAERLLDEGEIRHYDPFDSDEERYSLGQTC